MHKPPTPKRSIGRTTGANTLITAAALTLTLSGWAILTVREAEPATTEMIDPTPTALTLGLPALATLVPTPDWAVPNTPAAPPSAAAPATPRRVVVPPAPAAAPAPAQRPAPAAVTRSSR